ncbi:MAG: ATP-binding protein [Gammaproteobacteria bacterium]|jgi:two-component system sensor histidine kinase QseC|nr:ATP-binding protein [Gammaproteobacteria bacterium]
MSIKYHLMLRLLIASLLIVGGGTWLGYKDTQLEIRELFDAQLARSARLILSMVQADEGQSDFSSIQRYLDENQISTEELDYSAEENREPDSGHVYVTKLAFQIWDNLGNLILKSENAPIQPIAGEKNGFDNKTFLANDWRVFSLYSHNHKYRCITAERVDVRNDLITKLSDDLFLLFITLIPALSIVMWLAITQGLAPLHNLASQIGRRDASKLDAVSDINAPTEIQTIAGALNSLLSRLSQALDRERRISSDAAHELRTPLAAVRLHAELAKKSTTESDRNTALNHVLQSIDRTTHLVDQLLTLAKLEPEVFSKNLATLNLNSIVIEETAMLAPMAHRKNIELSVDELADAFISADNTSLRLLIRNLLDNAISYTQDNGIIKVKVRSTNGSVNLIIQDNGPGISAEQRERVCERFYRIGDSEVPGCGIGLSIVMRVVELHHATLKMSRPAGGTGLNVTVSFPVD